MSGIIDKIAALWGIRRDGKVLERKQRKDSRPRRKNDTVTISDEARRLIVSGFEEGPATEKERIG